MSMGTVEMERRILELESRTRLLEGGTFMGMRIYLDPDLPKNVIEFRSPNGQVTTFHVEQETTDDGQEEGCP